MEQNTLHVAIVDPFNFVAIDNLRHMTGMEIDIIPFSQEQMEQVIDFYYEKQREWRKQLNYFQQKYNF